MRVITLITKKYSILKTTTTTGKTPLAGCRSAPLSKVRGLRGLFPQFGGPSVWCLYINSKRTKKTAPAAPAEEADQFFSQHPIIYSPTHQKTRTPTGGVFPVTRTLIPVSYFLNREKSHFLKFQGSGVVWPASSLSNCLRYSFSCVMGCRNERRENPNLGPATAILQND